MLVVATAAAGTRAAERDMDKIGRVKAGEMTEARADWWGFDAADATRCLQDAMASGVKRLIVPNMGTPWIVHPVELHSDQEIVLEPGVVIEAIRGGFKGKNDCLFWANGGSNIVVRGGEGATWRMHKQDYQDPEKYERAEWRHTVGLRSCENVQLIGLTLRSSGGDGVYVGNARKPINYCKDIVIKDCLIEDHHRQGISVISVVNLLIENCVIKDTRGSPPQAGIDFEPNSSTERLFGIVVRNCRFENNAGGAVILFAHPGKDSEPISFHFENCTAIDNRFTGGFGATPPMDKITVTMTNCVERVEGTEKVFNDFWLDWQSLRPLETAQQAIVDRVGRVWSVRA
jgi:polygalacturonase